MLRQTFIQVCTLLIVVSGLGLVSVTGQSLAQSPPECSPDVWDDHLGRVALFTMYPAGQLTAQDASSSTTDFKTGVTYRDEAGIDWRVLPNGQNEFHQPEWFDESTPEGDPWPNLKFVALETAPGATGSYEAILQPDDEDSYADTEANGRPFTYGSLNWLQSGSLIGTYNYYDVSVSTILHGVFDVVPHLQRKSYAPVLVPVDSRNPAWATYQPRMSETLRDLVGNTLAPDSASPSGWSIFTAEGARLRKVDADLFSAVHMLAECDDLLECDGYAPTWEDLANSSNLFGLRDDEPVQVVDGRYEERFDTDGLVYSEVLDLWREWVVFDDLDGDCLQDAIAIVTWSGGASGVFYELMMLRNTGFGLVPVNRIHLGDRIVVEDMAAQDGQLTLDLIAKAPSDPGCCPSMPERQVRSYDELLGSTETTEQPTTSPAGEAPDPISHGDILTAIGSDEPNIFYMGSCAGDVVVQQFPAPAGATPFCGTILSSSPTEAVVELMAELGPVTITLVYAADGWRVDWDQTR